jgi:predicted GNAT family N-acyltransferase
VACGVFAKGEVAGLCWGLVAQTLHRKGQGSKLLQARLEYIQEHFPGVRSVKLDTSQHSAPFFERFGFVTQQILEHGYAEGLHRYEMVEISRS